MNRMRIGMRRLASTLEVLSTHQTAIDILIGHRDGAYFLKVEVECCTIHLLTRLEVESLSRSQARDG